MNKSSTKKYIYYATSIFLALYLIFYIIKGNYEFVIHIIVASLAMALVMWADKNINFNPVAVGGFSIWVLFHMLGGSVSFNGTRLYDTILIPIIGEPYNILKYDQALHTYVYLVIGMLLYHAVKPHLKKENTLTLIIIILAVTGIGALNEIFELGAVVFTGSTGVGGYINNALDLIEVYILREDFFWLVFLTPLRDFLDETAYSGFIISCIFL